MKSVSLHNMYRKKDSGLVVRNKFAYKYRPHVIISLLCVHSKIFSLIKRMAGGASGSIVVVSNRRDFM